MTREVSRTRLNMLRSYAAHDHRDNFQKAEMV
ncbi:hypothetical protein ACP_2477 [Acidobacterium capsulatum ATCC 51196]|uniref:Uncharacterized protein n=1 Tax=Acidobacterium capsulatum (strain ATCC 51196 / DSM 11244 / BCRC 80197 / JCM 7670 / NBRC 15755 / NCIMB 13165 / 161) TaxID=240015 RepID=C1F1G8_ACIC5|nr:hypothetical protein ACP_2477 [Acidobacterium capsulatum ATCC 51196]